MDSKADGEQGTDGEQGFEGRYSGVITCKPHEAIHEV